MPDAWIYIDESQAPTPNGVVDGAPFWLGALIAEHPIEQALIDQALTNLRADPDAVGNVLDADTLERGFFHASEDSKNAHSWICAAIVNGGIDAKFSATKWHFECPDSDLSDNSKLHMLMASLSVLTAMEDDYDCVNIFVAARAGSFEQWHAEQFADYCHESLLDTAVGMPGMPTRFPRLDVRLADSDCAGIQVCDFILWAAQRAKFDQKLVPRGKDDWIKRLKAHMHMTGGAQDSAQQVLVGQVGRGAERPILRPEDSPPPRDLMELNENNRWELLREMAQEIHKSASIADASNRISHLATSIHRASSNCDAVQTSAREEIGELLRDVMMTYLLVCDTFPTFDRTNGNAWSRAVEKRRLAASFLKQEVALWLPKGGSLSRSR